MSDDILADVIYCGCGRGLTPSNTRYFADTVVRDYSCPACERRWSNVGEAPQFFDLDEEEA